MPKFVGLSAVGIILLASVALSQARADVATAIQLYHAARYAEGRMMLEQVLATHQDDAVAHYYLGKIYIKLQNYDKAVEHCKAAVKIQKQNAEHHFCLGLSYGKKAQRGSFLAKAFLAPRIKKSFKQTVALDPNHIQARVGLANFYIRAPALLGGNLDKAYEQATILLKLDAEKGQALLDKVQQRRIRQSSAEAAALELLPDS
ncbi:MAG: tetratricopeptide repeat protein [bacterium]|nr:tetratricopeptide repeat protein [bacterium]